MRSIRWTLALLALAASRLAGADTITLDVEQVRLERDRSDNYDIVSILISEASQQTLKSFTQDRVGKTVRISVNSLELATPALRAPIDGRAMQMSLKNRRPDLPDGTAIAQEITTSKRIQISDPDPTHPR